MNYELLIAWRTLRREGLGPFWAKVRLYFHQLAAARRFLRMPRPPRDRVEETVDFSFEAADGLIRPGQVRSEIIQLARLVQGRAPATVVEIGTATGGTLFLWCAVAAPNALIVSLDLPGGIHGGGYPYWKSFLYRRFAWPGQRVELLRGDSHDPEMRDRLKLILKGKPIDFLFIDGDHTYEGVRADYELYGPLVRKGGLIAFHDVCEHAPELNCQVDRFWKEVREGKNWQEFIEDRQQGWCGIGVLEM